MTITPLLDSLTFTHKRTLVGNLLRSGKSNIVLLLAGRDQLKQY